MAERQSLQPNKGELTRLASGQPPTASRVQPHRASGSSTQATQSLHERRKDKRKRPVKTRHHVQKAAACEGKSKTGEKVGEKDRELDRRFPGVLSRMGRRGRQEKAVTCSVRSSLFLFDRVVAVVDSAVQLGVNPVLFLRGGARKRKGQKNRDELQGGTVGGGEAAQEAAQFSFLIGSLWWPGVNCSRFSWTSP